MKCAMLVFSLFFCWQVAMGQNIRNSFGKSVTQGDELIKVIADPIKLNPERAWGFQVDFEFTLGRSIDRSWQYYIQIEKIDLRKDLGFYHKYYPEAKGTFFSCAQLNNHCDDMTITKVAFNAIWEYNGKEFRTGAIDFSSNKDKSYLKSNVEINRPGGDVIPLEAAKSGAAKIVKIEVVAWNVSNEQNIINIVEELKKKSK